MNSSVITSIIGLIAIFICLMCAVGIYTPGRLCEWVNSMWKKTFTIYFAIGIRLVLGVLFLLAAPETRFPLFFEILGYFMITAAVLIGVIGRERLGRRIAWWKQQSPLFIRLWVFPGIAFGAFILYGIL